MTMSRGAAAMASPFVAVGAWHDNVIWGGVLLMLGVLYGGMLRKAPMLSSRGAESIHLSSRGTRNPGLAQDLGRRRTDGSD